jgi:NADH-quinone oxidoreductase subunit N
VTALLALQPTIRVNVEYHLLWPVLIMLAGPLVVLVVSAMSGRRAPSWLWPALSVLTAAGAMVAAVHDWLWTYRAPSPTRLLIMGGELAVDRFACWFFFIACGVVAVGALTFHGYVRRERLDGPEIYVLAMLSASGAMTMAMANDLIVLFLGLEILSIALYVMAGYHRRRTQSGEAAMKYFILGAFSSALFLYGVALTYGAAGSTHILEVRNYLVETREHNGLVLAGMGLLLVGLGFKVAAVPFHTWTPDVYEGSPTPVTGYMAALAKAAGFAGLLRIFAYMYVTPEVVHAWRPAVWTLAVLTLVVGAVVALVQTDLKRMLAYSSINHAGYVLVGMTAIHWANGGLRRTNGVSSALYYLLTYGFIILGSFAVVAVVSGRGDGRTTIETVRGLSTRRPLLAFSLTVFLAAQAGVPFTTGFLAKFSVVSAAVGAHEASTYVLAVLAMLVTAVSAFFYLRVIVVMYAGADDPGTVGVTPGTSAARGDAVVAGGAGGAGESAAGGGVAVAVAASTDTKLPVPVGTAVAISVCLLVTVGGGLWPGPLIDAARRALLAF